MYHEVRFQAFLINRFDKLAPHPVVYLEGGSDDVRTLFVVHRFPHILSVDSWYSWYSRFLLFE